MVKKILAVFWNLVVIVSETDNAEKISHFSGLVVLTGQDWSCFPGQGKKSENLCLASLIWGRTSKVRKFESSPQII